MFAELLRAFGARSRTRPIWAMSPFTNARLLVVVAISIGLQFLSHNNLHVASFLQTTLIPFETGMLLLLVGCVPLLVLEGIKVWTLARKR